MYIYKTLFNLTACVNDFDAAYNYLLDDDMTVYLHNDTTRIPQEVRDAVTSIKWILKDECSGYIELETNRSLSAEELKYISSYVSGQNSDGLGEGFEDQDFACYDDEGLSGFDNDDWDNEEIRASFDWQINSYIFEFVRKE